MKRQIVFIFAILVSFLAVSCGGNENSTVDGDYKDSIPDWDQMKINLPAGVAKKFKDSNGIIAQSYLSAVEMTRGLNPVLYGLLALVDEIVVNPPTKIEGNRKIWQADEPLSGLSAVVPRFIMGEQEDDGVTYITYSFEIRHKNDSVDEFKKIWGGRMAPDDTMARRGKGTMEIDFDTASSIDPNTKEKGLVTVEYDIRPDFDRTIDIYFEDFLAENATGEQILNATYKYLDAEDNSGSLNYKVVDNFVVDVNETEICDYDFDVKWQPDGTGQGLVMVSECQNQESIDIFEIKECWDDSFYQTYYTEWVYWNRDNPPSWANDNLDNPVIIEETRFGDIEECPFGF